MSDKFSNWLLGILGKLFTQYVLPPLLDKLSSLIPLAAAAAVKAVIDEIPGIDLVKDVGAIAEDVRGHINTIPDIDIPVLSDLFDLTDFMNRVIKK